MEGEKQDTRYKREMEGEERLHSMQKIYILAEVVHNSGSQWGMDSWQYLPINPVK